MDGKEVSIVSPHEGKLTNLSLVRRKEFIGVFLFLVTGCKGKRSLPSLPGQRLAQFHRRLSIIEQANLASPPLPTRFIPQAFVSGNSLAEKSPLASEQYSVMQVFEHGRREDRKFQSSSRLRSLNASRVCQIAKGIPDYRVS